MSRRALQPVFIGLFLALLPWFLVPSPGVVFAPYPSLSGFLKPLPFALLAGLAFLGSKLNQNRFLFLALYLAMSYAYLLTHRQLPFTSLPALHRTYLVSLATPITLCALFFLPNGRVWSRRGAAYAAATGLPLLCLAALFQKGQGTLYALVNWRIDAMPDGLLMPPVAILLSLAFGLSSLVFKDRSRRLPHVFVAVSLIPLFAGLNYRYRVPEPSHLDLVTALGFTCQAVLLVYGVFLLYWEKVYIDELTGIPNRRALNEHLHKLSKRFSVAMVDIDHFKKFNDTYGHEQGDHVLRYVATHLDRESKGRAFRYGGEEFTLLFDGEDAEAAAATMDRIRKSLGNRKFAIRPTRKPARKIGDKGGNGSKGGGKTVAITFSSGVAGTGDGGRSPQQLIQSADEALYEAKSRGRNRVVIADPQTRSYNVV